MFSRDKKADILLGIVMLLGASVCAFLLWRDDLFLDKFLTKEKGTVELGQIKIAHNDVRRRVERGLSWQNVRKDSVIYDNDLIYTGPESSAEVKLQKGSDLSIGPSTMVAVRTQKNKLPEFEIKSGEVQVKIKKGEVVKLLQKNKVIELKGTEETPVVVTIQKETKTENIEISSDKGSVDVVQSGKTSKMSEAAPLIIAPPIATVESSTEKATEEVTEEVIEEATEEVTMEPADDIKEQEKLAELDREPTAETLEINPTPVPTLPPAEEVALSQPVDEKVSIDPTPTPEVIKKPVVTVQEKRKPTPVPTLEPVVLEEEVQAKTDNEVSAKPEEEKIAETPFNAITEQYAWVWLGAGYALLRVDQETSGYTPASFQQNTGPGLFVGFGNYFSSRWGFDFNYKQVLGEAEGDTGITVSGGSFTWSSLSFDIIQKLNESPWFLRYGIQSHSLPAFSSPALNEIAVDKTTINMFSVGIMRTHQFNNRLYAEAFMRLQYPFGSSSNIEVDPGLSFDGSLGLIYRCPSKWTFGVFWYGQWLKYDATYKPSSGDLNTVHDLFYSNIDVRFGKQF